MERLSFSDAGLYSGLEASIHMARYAFVRHMCTDKVVLDLACGEGYGSRLLAQWGARRVVGVDISAEAIKEARRIFSTERVEFRTASAETIGAAFPSASFDLIVSLETIEHVPDPAALLGTFQRLLKPGGTIVISCPNDWWYYPGESEHNPFHLRKYTLDEFRTEVERVLGPARAWYFGAPTAGFCNTRLDSSVEAEPGESQFAMLRAASAVDVLALPAEPQAGPTATNASYFVGVWSTAETLPDMAGAALLPLSMDAFKDGFFAQAADTTRALRQEVATLQRRLEALEHKGVWVLDEGPMAHALQRAEQARASLDRCGGASADPIDQEMPRLRLLSRVADIEKSLLLAQVQRLKALHESHGKQREQARVARQRFDNERAAARAHHESLMAALRTVRETQDKERAAHAQQVTLMAALQAERDAELVAARTQQESLRIAQESLRVAQLEREEAQQEIGVLRERLSRLDEHAQSLQSHASRLDAQVQSLQLHANRYIRLRECIPEPIRRGVLALVRRARR